VIRITVAIVAAALMAASISGATEQPPESISTRLPTASVPAGLKPLGPDAPPWARRLYRRSIRVLVALTDPRSGALIAGEREGWDYVWPRDAAAGAIALEAAGLRREARRVVSFLAGLDLDDAARFYTDGSAVPGRAAAGDGEGWIAAAERATASSAGTVLANAAHAGTSQDGRLVWRGRQDYGENATGDLLGNAIAAGAQASEINGRFLTPRGLVREQGSDDLDSSAAWAATVFPSRGLRGAVRETLLELARESTPYGIPPIEGWTPGEVWTAATAWSAWALADLGETRAADRLLEEMRRAATPQGALPERVDAGDGHPTSTTPLAWSHAFAILALRARYSVR
jgi:glucoamylase